MSGNRAPKRIQRKRTKGWKMPPNTICAGRPSLLGNPFTVKDWGIEGAVMAFRVYVKHHYAGKALATFVQTNCKGKDFACWCPLDQPCHCDVYLEIANAESSLGNYILKSHWRK